MLIEGIYFDLEGVRVTGVEAYANDDFWFRCALAHCFGF